MLLARRKERQLGVQETRSVQGSSTQWDRLIEELQALRRRAGDPSYAEIAHRIGRQRTAQGVPDQAARIARTTVYDAFRPGRSRINLALVREIVAALEGDPAQVDGWVTRRHEPEVADPATRPGVLQVGLLLTACVALNLFGRSFETVLNLPIYLDMVGTAIASIALGPWHGVVVGVSTNLLGVSASGLASIPFGLVNVAGALLWGYGVRRWGLGGTLPRFFVLNLLVAAGCTLVAVPILLLVYGGSTGHGEDGIAASVLALTHSLVIAVGVSNLLVSVADKMISGFVALVAVSALPRGLQPRLTLFSSLAGKESAAREPH